MGWNGSGVVSPSIVWNVDKATFPNITATRMDSLNTDLAGAIQNCMAKDGQNAATANLNMGNFQLTNLAAGTLSNHAATVGQIASASPRNYLLNGNFRWWQRYGYTGSTSVAGVAAGGYIPDRWLCRRDGVQTGYTVKQGTSLTTQHPSPQQVGVQRDNGNASVVPIIMGQSIDRQDLLDLVQDCYAGHGTGTAGRTVQFVIYANRDTGVAGGTVQIEILTNASTYQPWTAGGWTQIATATYNALAQINALATRLTCTVSSATLAALVGSVAVKITYTPAGVAGANETIWFSSAQLVVSSSTQIAYYDPATSELPKLRSYFQSSFDPDTAPAAGLPAYVPATFPVTSAGKATLAVVQYIQPLRTGASPNLQTYRDDNVAGGVAINTFNGDSWANTGIVTGTAGVSGFTIGLVNTTIGGANQGRYGFNYIVSAEF